MNPDAQSLWRLPQWAFAVLLAVLGMLGPFSIDTYLPAFADIAASLGATLVLSFSVGLALTMVASGVLAAWSVGHATRRWSGFGHWAAKAPYISTVLMLLLALWMAGEGWHGLQAVAA